MEYQSPTDIIRRVGLYLGVAMPTQQRRLVEHLQGLEATRYELAEAIVSWHLQLADAKNRVLYPRGDKDLKLTDLDRTTMMDAQVSVIRKDYEFLCQLDALVRDRLELGKLLLQLNGNTPHYGRRGAGSA